MNKILKNILSNRRNKACLPGSQQKIILSHEWPVVDQALYSPPQAVRKKCCAELLLSALLAVSGGAWAGSGYSSAAGQYGDSNGGNGHSGQHGAQGSKGNNSSIDIESGRQGAAPRPDADGQMRLL